MKLKIINTLFIKFKKQIMDVICLCALLSFVTGFSLSSNNLLLKVKEIEYMSTVGLAIDEQNTIVGKVTDENGQSLPGVNIVIKGTSTGTQTNFDGNYTINAKKGDILIFSYLGFKTEEITVATSNTINIILKEDTETLDQVIITALGEKRSVKSIGYAATNIKSQEISETTENNVINALSGKVAGLDITSSSGGVGSSSRIILRGIKSASPGADSQPLFVVDGVPVNNNLRSGNRIDYGNSIADFNPDDIAEITVLKSAAASALYGSRGANGVIVIRTKSGSEGKNFGLEVNNAITISNPFRLIDYQNQYGPGVPGIDWDYNNRQGGSNGWGNAFGVQDTAVQWNSPLDADGNLQPLPLRAYPNNARDFFDTGVIRDNSISITKGEAGKYNFRLALRNVHEDGMVPTTELTRNTITFNAGAHITEKLKANVSLIYSDQDSPNRVANRNWSDNPIRQALIIPRHIDINALRNYETLLANGVPLPSELDPVNGNPDIVAPGWEANNSDFYPNPFFTLNNVKNEYENDRIFAVANIIYKFNNWLSLDTKVSKEIINEKIETKRNTGVRLWNGTEYSYDGSYIVDQFTRNTTFANALLKTKHTVGDFGINGLAGFETTDFILDGNRINIQEIEIPDFFSANNSGGEPETFPFFSQSRINSIYGSLDIDYKKLFYLTITARNDWNSTLPENNRSYFFPSASLSFIVSDIFKLPSAISYLKIRGNAGMVGSGTAPYQLQPELFKLRVVPGVFDPSIDDNLNNPTLRPTTTTTYEVGADIRFFNNRLNFDVAGYIGKSIDQIQRVGLPSSTGSASRIINAGDIENKGIELAVNATPIEGDITWDIGLTYAKNENKVLSLAEGVSEIPIASRYSNIRTVGRAGEPYGQLVGNGYKRDPQGNIIHENGNVAQTDEPIVLGNVNPDWIGSFSTTFKYKSLSLSAQVNARVGGDLFSLTNQWAAENGLTENTLTPYRSGNIVGNGVMELPDGTFVPNNVSVPYEQYIRNLMRWGFHEPVVYDATFVKLQAIQLYYTFPKKLMKKLPFQNMKMGLVGRNLALLYSKAPNIDPESTASAATVDQGFELFNLPTARSFTFNLTLKF